MKKAILLLILCISAFAAKAETFFESCEKIQGASTIYVSKAMKSMAGNLDIVDGDVDLNSLASKIDGLWVVTGEGKTAAEIKNKAKTALDTSKYEKLLSVKEDSQNVDIMMRSGNGNKNECIVYATEPSETTVIIITGTFTLQDIIKATKR